MATKRTRSGRYPAGVDQHVLAYLKGEPCPDGVRLSAQAREQIVTARFFDDVMIGAQVVDASKFGAVPEDQRDSRWYAL